MLQDTTKNKHLLWPLILNIVIINGIIPYLCYVILKGMHASDIVALSVAAVAPALETLIGFVRSRSLNIISLFVLGGLLLGIVLTFLGGDPRLLLIRESFFTCLLGITCFVSLLFPRPLMFLIGRTFMAGNSPEGIERYNQLWQRPRVRRIARMLTFIWGCIYIAEFALRVLIAFTLTIAQALAIGPIITVILVGGALLWTLSSIRRARQQEREEHL